MYALLGSSSQCIGVGGARKHQVNKAAAVPRTGLTRSTPNVVKPWHGVEHAHQRAVGVRFKQEQAPGAEKEEPAEDPIRAFLPTAVPSGHKVVTFELHKHCQFGDMWAVCGSAPELGAWDATKALPLKWTPGDKWLAAVALPEDSKLEFKVVVLDSKNGNKVKGWANDVTKDNIVLDMAQHNSASRGGCSVQVLAPASATGARPPTTTTGLQPGMTMPVGSSNPAATAESGAAAVSAPPAVGTPQSSFAHNESAPQHHSSSSTTTTTTAESMKAAAHKMKHAIEDLKGPQHAGAEPPAAQGGAGDAGALHMPHIAGERRDLTPEEVEKSRAAAGVRVFEAGSHTPEAFPSVTMDRVVPPGSTVSSTADLVSDPTGPEVTAWPAAVPISSMKPNMPQSTATTPTPASPTPVVSEQYSSGNAPPPAGATAGATSGAGAFSPAETADIGSSVAGMSTPATGAAAAPVKAADTGSGLSGMATPATGGAAPPSKAAGETVSSKISKGVKNQTNKTNRKQQQQQQQQQPEAKPKGSAKASKVLAQDAGLEMPMSDTMVTGASVIDNMGGGDEELPMAPLASGVTPVTGPSAASGSSLVNPKKNPIVMAASTLLSKMSELLSGSADSVRTVDVPEDYEAAMESGSVNAEGAAVSKTATSPTYNPNLGNGFVYPSAALFTRAAAEGAGRGAADVDTASTAPESGSQRGAGAGNEPAGSPASSTEAARESDTHEPMAAEPSSTARASTPSASDAEAASAPESGTRNA